MQTVKVALQADISVIKPSLTFLILPSPTIFVNRHMDPTDQWKGYPGCQHKGNQI